MHIPRILVACFGAAALVSSGLEVVSAGPEIRSGRGVTAVLQSGVRLENGDLIFRQGLSLTSRVVLAADDRSPYSHVGLVAVLDDGFRVVHVQPQDGAAHGHVEVERLSAFLADDKAKAAAFYRVEGASRALREQAVDSALGDARRRLPFDDGFSLRTGDKLYCTELVWRAYVAAGLDLVDGRFDDLAIPFGEGPYLLPSRILNSRHVRLLGSF